ncbi:hypothetical protein HGH93_21500 [Chitinophaga polysaccharea]|uniref:hypothetical protein n=1 Tax=Chitinophaga polysaccharea TaxID=1293035 RepID=UPI0014556A20|nr:hypothetical protein [Chitinophaga polysaccharea]NLR60700.1 hypothetical protein [Chitinophaga polysaccharea]
MSLPSPTQDTISQLIRITALTTGRRLSDVEKAVRHQFKSAALATQQHSTVEISGIGYLYLSEKKMRSRLTTAKKILAAYEAKSVGFITEAKRKSLEKRIDSIKSLIERYESRLERTRTGNV